MQQFIRKHMHNERSHQQQWMQPISVTIKDPHRMQKSVSACSVKREQHAEANNMSERCESCLAAWVYPRCRDKAQDTTEYWSCITLVSCIYGTPVFGDMDTTCSATAQERTSKGVQQCAAIPWEQQTDTKSYDNIACSQMPEVQGIPRFHPRIANVNHSQVWFFPRASTLTLTLIGTCQGIPACPLQCSLERFHAHTNQTKFITS